MPIEFRCSSCNKLLRVPDGSEGKKAQCPDCQAILEIPVVATEAPTSSPFGAAPGPTGFDPPPASDNPFESPRASAYAGDLTSDQAMSRVSAPATCLIVVSAIGIALYIISTQTENALVSSGTWRIANCLEKCGFPWPETWLEP